MYRLLFLSLLLFPYPLFAATPASTTFNFSGSWQLSGQYEELGSDSSLHLYRLSGIVRLDSPLFKEQDLWSHCIALKSREASAELRCVIQGADGANMEVLARGEQFSVGEPFVGEIISGTGRYKGVVGNFTLSWQALRAIREERHLMVTGESIDLKGSCTFPQ